MAIQLCLITCSNFDREILAVQSSPDLQDVRFRIHPVDCDQVESPWPGLGEAVAACRRDGCPVALAGGYCLTRPSKELGLDGLCRLHQKSQCFEWLAGKEVLDGLLRDGALIVLPGWLRDWEAHLDARWPSDRKAAQAFFRELARKVVLLDTGVHPGIDRDLKAFARFLRLPHETHPVGLGYFQLSLVRIALAWRLERERAEVEDRLAGARQKMSDYARIGQLLGAVAGVKTEADVRTGVLELFRVLLEPREVVFHPAGSFTEHAAPEGSPVDRIVGLNADYAWTEDRRTLFLKVAHDREILGIVEMSGFGSPDRRDHDLDLALGLARISGLALANARTFQALVEERVRAAGAEAALASGEEKMTRIFNYPLGLYRTTPQGQIIDATPTLARMLGYPDVQALKSVNFWDIHHDPRDRDSWQAVLDSSPMVEIFETQLRRSNGTLFFAKDSSRAAKDSRGNVLFYDGVIEDITRKKQMEEEHSWDVRLQASVGDVSERLLSPTPIEEISAVVMEHARRLTSSATAFVGHIDGQTGRLVPAALTPDARGVLSEHPGADGALHEGSGLWRWILEKKKPILTNMTSLDPRFTGMPDWHIPVRQFLAVPALMEGQIVGLIVVANGEESYVERDLKAVERLATLYAIAVQRTRTESALREMSLVDELTRIYNRRGFMTLAEQQIKVAHRTRKEMSLFYADLDDLKKINDAFGHKEGDAVLVEAAGLLRDAFRDSDIIARLGGDEFVVLAIDVAEGRATALARRLRERIAARNARPDAAYPVSFSLGIARYEPDDPVSLEDLLARADARMYQDKATKKAVLSAA
jgi:diguanylate cyclase (GGDEF)-like protein/PAS domain S-box-containing protein